MAYLNDPIGQAGQRWSAQAPLSTDALAAQRERMARYGMPLQDQSPQPYAGMTGQGGTASQYNPYGQEAQDPAKLYPETNPGYSGGLLDPLVSAQKSIWKGMLQIPGAINWLGQKLS